MNDNSQQGLLWIIGQNLFGQLGLNHRRNIKNITQHPKGHHIRHISIGNTHCVYSNDDNNNVIYVAGDNGFGQCGVGTNNDNEFIKTFNQINYFKDNKIKINKICTNLSSYHTIFLCENNNYNNNNNIEIYGAGYNDYNQLGISDPKNLLEPNIININNQIDGNIIDVITSANYSILLNNNGDVYSTKGNLILNNNNNYGGNGHGDNNKFDKNILFKKINNLSNISSVSCGELFTLFLDNSGNIHSCGINSAGELGLGNFNNDKTMIATKININIKFQSIECGLNYSLALSINNKLFGWGSNEYGQIGDGSVDNINNIKLIDGLKNKNITSYKCGNTHSYCCTDQNEYYLFGSNYYNECTLYDNQFTRILLPFYINNIIKIKTKSSNIKQVYLGDCNTFIFVDNGDNKDDNDDNKDDDKDASLASYAEWTWLEISQYIIDIDCDKYFEYQLLLNTHLFKDKINGLNILNITKIDLEKYGITSKDDQNKIYDSIQKFGDILDNKNHIHWNTQNVINWIISLNKIKYKKYENILTTNLNQKKFIGKDLNDLDLTDLKEYGIIDLNDRKFIYKSIQTLIVNAKKLDKQKKNINNVNTINDNNNDNDNTNADKDINDNKNMDNNNTGTK